MYSSVLTLLSLSALAHSYGLHKRANASDAWVVERFSSLLTFGDSYTDENRLNYFGGHNGTAPPNGTLLPEVSFNSGIEPSTTVFDTSCLELRHRWGRTHMGSLCHPVHRIFNAKRHMGPPDDSIRLCCQWRRMLERDHTPDMEQHQCQLPLRGRL